MLRWWSSDHGTKKEYDPPSRFRNSSETLFDYQLEAGKERLTWSWSLCWIQINLRSGE